MLSSAGVVADCSLHRTSAIQDLQVLAGTQQLSSCSAHHRSAIQDLEELSSAVCRLFLTPHICHPGPAGPGRSSAALGSTGVVADCSFHRAAAIQDLQVLAGAQQCSALLELWQIVPYTTDLPSRTCRSWKELSSAGPVADCSLHRTSAFQDLQVLEGAQQRSAAWSCGRLLLTPHICHPGPAGLGRSSTALSTAGAVADCSLHHRSAIQDQQVLAGAPQHWSCGRLFLTPQLCHPGPAGPDRRSEVLGDARAMAESSPHHKSAIQDL